MAESKPWPLKCAADASEFLVLVKLTDDDDGEQIELSKAEIDAARESQQPVRLVIVADVVVATQRPTDNTSLATGGEVTRIINGDWFRDDRLTPIRFRLPVGVIQVK